MKIVVNVLKGMVILNYSGHVPRNMRVALAMIDLAAPYINISKTDLDKSKKKIDIWWKIGASIKVKNTWLY